MLNKISSNFAYAFSPEIFFSVRGCENVHIYFWIAKDLCWIMNVKEMGMFFGLCAILCLGVLLYHAFRYKNNEEKYFLVPTALWLLGNYIWMSGNLLYGTDIYRFPASCMMMTGLLLIVLYFLQFKNKEYFIPNEETTRGYNENGLVCRFPIINTWRRYELVHVFFWLLKDYSWCSFDKLLWVVGAIPTLFISIDFIVVAAKNKKMVVDISHYVAQLIWIFSNLTWAMVELFNIGGKDGDNSQSYYRASDHPNGRLVASIILILAYVPIFVLYLIWLPLSVSGKINSNTNKSRDIILSDHNNDKMSDSNKLEFNETFVIVDV